MTHRALNHRPRHAKLIFNPTSGVPGQSPIQLMDVICKMQDLNYLPEVAIVNEGLDLAPLIRDALRRSIHLFVVCGGDGTVNRVATMLPGKHATLAIVPTGTRNNVARSLNIPVDIPAALALLETGRHVKVDLGRLSYNGQKRPFMELCSVGLISALYSAADEVQHGNLARLGEFLGTLFATPAAEMRIVLDKKHEIRSQSHGVLISNTTFFGLNYQLGDSSSMADGLLDVLLFADLSKLNLMSGAVQMAGGPVDDPRVHRYQAKHIKIETTPAMPIMADGETLGEGPARITVKPKTLTVIAGQPAIREPAPEADLEAAPA
jgi:diacylglycerol kinase (ATP)